MNLVFKLQTGLVIRGLFICKFAYSQITMTKLVKNDFFPSQKWNFYQQIQDWRSKKNDGTYLPRITMEICSFNSLTVQHFNLDKTTEIHSQGI